MVAILTFSIMSFFFLAALFLNVGLWVRRDCLCVVNHLSSEREQSFFVLFWNEENR